MRGGIKAYFSWAVLGACCAAHRYVRNTTLAFSQEGLFVLEIKHSLFLHTCFAFETVISNARSARSVRK